MSITNFYKNNTGINFSNYLRAMGVTALVIILFAGSLYSQPGISSPYSSYGVGYLSHGNNVRSLSLGRSSEAIRNHYTINHLNPASYSAFDSTSFVFEAGVLGMFVNYNTVNVTERLVTGTLSHILMGFPVTKWLRTSMGLVPYSTVGYNVSSNNYKEEVGNIRYHYFGDGGLTRAYIGGSIQPFKFLSIGANLSYIWGSTNKAETISFPDSINLTSTKIDNTIKTGDIYSDFGFQFYHKLNDKINFVLGATYAPKSDLASKSYLLARSYAGEVEGIYNYKDTIFYNPVEKGSITLPKSYGFGVSFEEKDKWLFSIEYRQTQWSDFRRFGFADSLDNSYNIITGAEYIPDVNSAYSYWKKIRYRVGGHFSKSYLLLRGEHIKEFGITFGLGLPLKGSQIRGNNSMINFGLEFGSRGTEYRDLVKENYVNVYFSISIQERWFIKRKYQ